MCKLATHLIQRIHQQTNNKTWSLYDYKKNTDMPASTTYWWLCTAGQCVPALVVWSWQSSVPVVSHSGCLLTRYLQQTHSETKSLLLIPSQCTILPNFIFKDTRKPYLYFYNLLIMPGRHLQVQLHGIGFKGENSNTTEFIITWHHFLVTHLLWNYFQIWNLLFIF